MQPQQNTATTASLTAPVGGWNARDSLAAMPPTDAVNLTNFWLTPTDVRLRNGWTKYSTGITGQVNTVMTYAAPSGQQLLAAAGTKIYNCTNSGTATTSYTGITSDKMQWVDFSNIGGYYLVACNGSDPVMVYNGTSWLKIATTSTGQTISSITHTGNVATLTTSSAHGLITGNQVTITGATPSDYNGVYIITVTSTTTFTYTMATTPSGNASVVGTYIPLGITGVDSSTFINVNLFQNRLYFTQENTLKCWYLPVNSLGGAAQVLDFGGIARNGSFLQAMGTWTVDGGQGVNDHAVFVTKNGEVIVYQGGDPSDATTFSLVGVWQFGEVFCRKCFFKFGSDLLLLMKEGLVPLSAALQSDRLNPRVFLTDKIYYAINQEIAQYADNFGWQITYFADQTMLLINIPSSTGTQQYVMNTITDAWAQFTNISTTCFTLFNDQLYFGGSGFVGKFWDSNADNGNNIFGNAQQAYSYFESPGQNKRFTLIRPIIQSDNGVPTVLCNISTDFQTVPPVGQLSFNPGLTQVGTWDNGKWDLNKWGGGYLTTKNWQGVQGIGFSASVNMNVLSQGIDFHWVSTDYVFQKGGVL